MNVCRTAADGFPGSENLRESRMGPSRVASCASKKTAGKLLRVTGLAMVMRVSLTVTIGAEPSELARIRELYRRGDYLTAAKLIDSAGALDAEWLLLAGQVNYRAGNLSAACRYFERATIANPTDSSCFHWLGRAYGRRAESADVLLAPRYAVLARQKFEEAVRLDPKNIEAWNDLFAYYLDAPRILGGGLDKAIGVAERVLLLDVAEYHYDRARIAEKQKDLALAEHHYRMAAKRAPTDAGRQIGACQ